MDEMAKFADNVCTMLDCEHGTSNMFEYLRPWINAAFMTEGNIPEDLLEELCMGEESPERRKLEEQYPKLTRIFEAVFDGEEPFPL